MSKRGDQPTRLTQPNRYATVLFAAVSGKAADYAAPFFNFI
jgi:hypothetical protein